MSLMYKELFKSVRLLPLLLSGCGINSLNMACPNASNADIDALITVVETDRNIGFTKEEEVDIVLSVCTGEDCIPCLLAIVNEVYR